MSGLYTLIVEYRGGTYIAQIRAESPMAAILSWSKRSEKATPKEVISALKDLVRDGEALVSIYGCKNVWCSSASLNGNLLLVNIVRTTN